MAILKVYSEPDSCLRTKSIPVNEINDEVLKLLDDMLETMYATNGVGLAANQIGVTKRLVVIDTEWGPESTPRPMKLINPEITWFSDDKVISNEGCLSVPDCYAEVNRSAEVKATYLDENGKRREIQAAGLLAECLQHEVDHINGILFIDYLSPLKKKMILRKLAKAKKLQREA